MIPKDFVIPVLLVGMMLLGVVGCGEDLKTPEELIPEDFFQVAFDQATVEAEQDYDEGFRSDFIQPFAQSACTKQGDTLVLVIPTGEEMVLEKR